MRRLGVSRAHGAAGHAPCSAAAPALLRAPINVRGLCVSGLCGLLLMVSTGPSQACCSELVLLDSNTAIISDLKRLSKTQRRFGVQDPLQATQTLSNRLEASQQQLQRIELLIKIQQYDNARLQLREGAFKTLRLDLGYGQEMYRVVSPAAVRQVVDGIQQLDTQLKRREPVEAIKPNLQQLQEQLGNLAELIGSLQ